ncbi:MAG: hypothetical protein LUF35_12165 [Lachnospiraceae bacterium]|nr:hypothetical protein [Lachnospiraceae bacterium]
MIRDSGQNLARISIGTDHYAARRLAALLLKGLFCPIEKGVRNMGFYLNGTGAYSLF